MKLYEFCERMEAIAPKALALDYDNVGDEICAKARLLVEENPDVGAILLECTDMPPYAHRIQAELNLPVYDAITLIKYAKSTVTQMPYYGFL